MTHNMRHVTRMLGYLHGFAMARTKYKFAVKRKWVSRMEIFGIAILLLLFIGIYALIQSPVALGFLLGGWLVWKGLNKS